MATITGKTFTYRPRGVIRVLSDAALPADDVELSGLPQDANLVELSVRFFDGVGAPITATAGEFVVEILTETNDQLYEKPGQSTIVAIAPTTLQWTASTIGVRVTPTNLAGPTTWRVALAFK